MPTHYQVLGVAEDADTETIRRAYVALAKATHPDRRRADEPAARARAEERIRQANVAWHVLRDPARRREYDLSLPGPSGPSSSSPSSRPASSGPRPRPGGIVGAMPQSGVVVPVEHASLWKFAPVAILLVVLLGILVVSAYATAGDDATAPASSSSSAAEVPEIDDCVIIVPVDGVRAPAPVGCGTAAALRVVAKVDTPRPCPPSTQQLPLSDNKTTLCLGVVP